MSNVIYVWSLFSRMAGTRASQCERNADGLDVLSSFMFLTILMCRLTYDQEWLPTWFKWLIDSYVSNRTMAIWLWRTCSSLQLICIVHISIVFIQHFLFIVARTVDAGRTTHMQKSSESFPYIFACIVFFCLLPSQRRRRRRWRFPTDPTHWEKKFRYAYTTKFMYCKSVCRSLYLNRTVSLSITPSGIFLSLVAFIALIVQIFRPFSGTTASRRRRRRRPKPVSERFYVSTLF